MLACGGACVLLPVWMTYTLCQAYTHVDYEGWHDSVVELAVRLVVAWFSRLLWVQYQGDQSVPTLNCKASIFIVLVQSLPNAAGLFLLFPPVVYASLNNCVVHTAHLLNVWNFECCRRADESECCDLVGRHECETVYMVRS